MNKKMIILQPHKRKLYERHFFIKKIQMCGNFLSFDYNFTFELEYTFHEKKKLMQNLIFWVYNVAQVEFFAQKKRKSKNQSKYFYEHNYFLVKYTKIC